MVQLGAAALGRDFGLVENEMYPAVWQGAELAAGTEVSSPKHTSSVHRDMGQCPLSVFKGSQILVSSGLRGLGVTSFLSAMPH